MYFVLPIKANPWRKKKNDWIHIVIFCSSENNNWKKEVKVKCPPLERSESSVINEIAVQELSLMFWLCYLHLSTLYPEIVRDT